LTPKKVGEQLSALFDYCHVALNTSVQRINIWRNNGHLFLEAIHIKKNCEKIKSFAMKILALRNEKFSCGTLCCWLSNVC
jgi:hypothetical protein